MILRQDTGCCGLGATLNPFGLRLSVAPVTPGMVSTPAPTTASLFGAGTTIYVVAAGAAIIGAALLLYRALR